MKEEGVVGSDKGGRGDEVRTFMSPDLCLRSSSHAFHLTFDISHLDTSLMSRCEAGLRRVAKKLSAIGPLLPPKTEARSMGLSFCRHSGAHVFSSHYLQTETSRQSGR